MPAILVIDDNAAVGTALELLFSLHDIDVSHAASPAEGLRALVDGSIDLVIQDMNFTADTTSGEEGVALFRAIAPTPRPAGGPADGLDPPGDGGRAGQGGRRRLPGQAMGRPQAAATVKNLLELAEAHANSRRTRRRATPTRCTAARLRPARPGLRRTPARACWRWPARSRAPTCPC